MAQRSQNYKSLRYERERRGWTQKDLGEMIDAHWKTISLWERGIYTPDLYHVRRLIAVFDKSIEELGFQIGQEQQEQNDLDQTGFLQQEWREVLPDGQLYGRKKELAILEQWIAHEYGVTILVYGFGGMGKTSLVTTLTKKIHSAFAAVFWYSLRTAPPFREFVNACMQYLSSQQHIELPEEQSELAAYLLTWLRKQHALLILDNFESVLQNGDHTGKYQEEYEGYGLLLEQTGRGIHKSCLLLTSREKPREFARLESSSTSIHSLHLEGITTADGQKMLKKQDVSASKETVNRLVQLYAGNPLALKLIAGYVKEMFGGDVAAFLEAEKTVFGTIYDLLEQQFHCLSEQEQEIVYWLAVEQQLVSFRQLWENMVHPISKRLLLDVLDSLCRRSLILASYGGLYSLQSVVAEYILEKLTKQIYCELETEQLNFFRRVSLMRAQVQESVRNAQTRLILMPVLALLLGELGEQGSEGKLRRILALLHMSDTRDDDYVASNLLHLLIQMHIDLRGIDFSSLVLRQADLRGVDLPATNFSFAYFINSTFTDTFGSIACVAFNASGSLFAAGMISGEVRVWRTSHFELVHTFQGHTDVVRSIAFSPDGRLLASGSQDQTVHVWDVAMGERSEVLYGHNGPIRSIAFHPTGEMLASSSEDRSVRIYRHNTGECIKELSGHIDWVRSVAFAPDGRLFISGDDHGHIKVWELETGRCLDTVQAHAQRIRSVVYSPNGDLFVSSGDDVVIRVWDAQTRQLRYTLDGPMTHYVRSVALSPDGKLLAAGGDDQAVYLWEVSTGRSLATLQGHTNRIWSVAFHPREQMLLSGSEDQTIRLWDLNTGLCQHILQGYRSPIWSIALNSYSTLLSSGSDDSLCRIWELASGRCLQTLRGHMYRVRCTAFSPDGTIVATGSEDLTIRLWDVATGHCNDILHGHMHLVHSLAFHPDGNILVSGSHDRSIRLWDLTTGYCFATLHGCDSRVWHVAFSPDGRLIASGSEDSVVRLWDMQARTCLALLQGHKHRICSVAFSPDGQFVASGSDDRTIRIWKVSDGCCEMCLRGHTDCVRALAFSPEGNVLASGSHDMTVCLWDVSAGQCQATFRGHGSWIWSVAFSADGEFVASGSDDGTIKLWDRYTGKCLKTLRSERPYESMNITGVTGLSEAQKKTLKALGAIVDKE